MPPTSPTDRDLARRRPAPNSRDAGLTLLELLVVIAIMVSLTAAIPGFFIRDLPGQEQMRRDVMAALGEARTDAILSGAPQDFVVDPGNRRFGAGEAERAFAGETALSLTTARELSRTDGTARIRFFGDGSSSGGVVEIKGSAGIDRIEIRWLTGAIRHAN